MRQTDEVQRDDGGPIDGPLRVELERALAVADRANNATVHEREGRWTVQGDPTEGALLVAARKCGLSSDALDKRLPRVGEVPFSSERKLMSTLHRDLEQQARGIVFTKGAPDVLLTRCSFEVLGDGRRPLTPSRREEILQVNEALAGEALRTLGVAGLWVAADVLEEYAAAPDARVEQDLVFAGLIGMIDPPRTEAKDAVARAKGAGIRPLMITGDHPRTAAVIAQELGITEDGRAITGAELEKLPEAERARTVAEVSVYARVNPEHKLRIVEALRRNGAVVAMTGDGVNDAPALKKADIGIAMGITGTDVSKEAADMVLADDNFASIVAAVEEGRAIFANIRKFLRYLLSSNIGEVLTMFFGVVLAQRIGLHAEGGGLVLPLLATQILWINLVTDGLPALALGVDPADEGLMQQPPRPAGEGVLTPRMWRGIVFVGVIMAAGTLFVLDASLPGGFVEGSGELRYAQTMAFTTLMLFQMFNVLNARSDERSAFVHLFTNHWLWTALGVSLLLQVVVIYTPFLQRAFGTVSLSPQDWVFCAAIASSVLWLREISKLVARAVRNSLKNSRMTVCVAGRGMLKVWQSSTLGDADGACGHAVAGVIDHQDSDSTTEDRSRETKLRSSGRERLPGGLILTVHAGAEAPTLLHRVALHHPCDLVDRARHHVGDFEVQAVPGGHDLEASPPRPSGECVLRRDAVGLELRCWPSHPVCIPAVLPHEHDERQVAESTGHVRVRPPRDVLHAPVPLTVLRVLERGQEHRPAVQGPNIGRQRGEGGISS